MCAAKFSRLMGFTRVGRLGMFACAGALAWPGKLVASHGGHPFVALEV